MTQARSLLAPANAHGIYHCISRCVRRAWLCGIDDYSGKSYEHRRQWVEDRLAQLAELYAVSIWAYAVMSNHLHVVVEMHVDISVHEQPPFRRMGGQHSGTWEATVPGHVRPGFRSM